MLALDKILVDAVLIDRVPLQAPRNNSNKREIEMLLLIKLIKELSVIEELPS